MFSMKEMLPYVSHKINVWYVYPHLAGFHMFSW